MNVEKLATRIFCVLCGILMAILFYNSMCASWINEQIWNELVTERSDNIWFNVLGILLGIALSWIVAMLVSKCATDKGMHVAAIVIGILCTAVSAYWVYAMQTGPEADQRDIVEYAKAYALGDTTSLLKGGYVANYPQQLGLITFMRVLFLIFGQGNYKAYQYFNACMVFLIVYSGYQIVRYLTGKHVKAEAIYLLFMILCVPMYGYAPFIYGEIASIALMLAATWTFLSILRRFRWWKLVILAIFCGGMVQFRKNALICVIAFLVVLVVKFVRRPQRELGLTGAAVLAGVIGFQMVISAIYAPYMGEDAEPIPTLLYVAMGTHYSPDIGAGWHDGYDLGMYRTCGFDPEIAKEAAKQDIREFLEKCKADPRQLFLFYDMKINSQWNAPMYQCIVMNSSFYDAPKKIAQQICFLGGDRYLESFMEIYQLLIYGGALLFLIWKCKKAERIENVVLMICVYGGFLFSVLWEAKTRYVFPYFMMMIPCAVAGIAESMTRLSSKIKRRKNR